MARLFSTGFELNSNAANVEMDAVVSTSTVTISSTTLRSGAFALRSKPTSSVAGNARMNIYAADTQVLLYIRAYIYIAAVGSAVRSMIAFNNSSNTNKVGIRLNTDQTLQLRDLQNGATVGTSSALALNTWYRVELKVDTTTLASTIVEAKIDGNTFASGTINLSGAASRLGLGCDAVDSTYDVYFDDVAVNDNTGTYQESWPGAGKIIYLHPDSAGDVNTFATQTGGTAGSANNFTRVKEVTPDDATTLNGSNTLNQEDLFNCGASGIGANDTVNVVAIGCRFRNNTADATTAIKFELEKAASGTKSQSSAIIPNSTTFKTNATATPWLSPLTTYQDPDSANWTQATLDSMQIGYKLTTGGTNRIDVSTIFAVVDYTPANINAEKFLSVFM